MTFTQVDDAWADSPAVTSVSRSARLLEIEGKGYCNRHLTDGRITRTQWSRATDSESFAAEVAELISAGLAEEVEPGVYQLDWSHQQTREQVESNRARKRADNERRAKSLALHNAGDHSLCTHAGGGLSRGRRGESSTSTSSGSSSGPSIGESTSTSSGPSIRSSSGPSRGRAGGRPPTTPLPARSETEGGRGDRGAVASAGAPAPVRAGGEETPSRTMPGGYVVTADMVGGADPNTLSQDEIENRVGAWLDARGLLLGADG